MTRTHHVLLATPPVGMERLAGVTLLASDGVIREMRSPTDSLFMQRFGRAGAVLFIEPQRPRPDLQLEFDLDAGATLFWEPIPAHPGQAEGIHRSSLRRAERATLDAAPTVLHRRAALYFHAIDVACNPRLAEHAEASNETGVTRVASIGETAQAIYANVMARLAGSPNRTSVGPGALAPVSGLLLPILADHFPGHTLPDLARRTARAHALFGAGELHFAFGRAAGDTARKAVEIVSNAGPNSTYLLAFPEFALAAVRAGVDAALWRPLLPGLLAACEAFLLCYGRVTDEAFAPSEGGRYASRFPDQSLAPDLLDAILDDHSRLNPGDIDAFDERLNALVHRGLLPPVQGAFMVHDSAAGTDARRFAWPAPRRVCRARVMN